jgi:phosphoribosylanthranilate isomerase
LSGGTTWQKNVFTSNSESEEHLLETLVAVAVRSKSENSIASSSIDMRQLHGDESRQEQSRENQSLIAVHVVGSSITV